VAAFKASDKEDGSSQGGGTASPNTSSQATGDGYGGAEGDRQPASLTYPGFDSVYEDLPPLPPAAPAATPPEKEEEQEEEEEGRGGKSRKGGKGGGKDSKDTKRPMNPKKCWVFEPKMVGPTTTTTTWIPDSLPKNTFYPFMAPLDASFIGRCYRNI